MIFSTRELASIFWLLIIIIYLLNFKEIRNSFYNIFKAFIAKKLLIIWIPYIIYIVFLTYIFSLCSFWNIFFIKDIILWSITSGILNYINAADNKSNEQYISKILKDNLKLLVIIEFF